jgi:hypothetical protein
MQFKVEQSIYYQVYFIVFYPCNKFFILFVIKIKKLIA